MAAGERMGILGGTFDPPHVAHLALAQAARDQCTLDRVLFVVAADPWQKRERVEAAAHDRLAMVEAAVADRPGFEASDVEIRRGGPTYTADTLEVLEEPGRELFLIVGADVASSIETWHRPERVRDLATLLVARRPTEPAAEAVVEGLRGRGWRGAVVDAGLIDVSSTDVRNRLRSGHPIDGMVPPAVVHVIEERALYTRPQ